MFSRNVSRHKSKGRTKNSFEPYRSKLELYVAGDLGKKWKYEAKEGLTDYTLEYTYLPDFYYENKLGYVFLIEVKGYFRPGDTKKYAGVAKALRNDELRELIFVFSDPNKPVRKGAKLTMAKWAEKHGCAWFAANDIHSLKEYCNA